MNASFTLMVKPVGSLCNMACQYCYYLGNEVSNRKPMDLKTLETLIRNYFASNPGPIYSFIWHGGEPMLRGLDFYKKAVELEKKYLPQGKECWNNLQTNGLLIDEEWCRFLKKEAFDVGISIDGSKMIHDTYRKDNSGNPTYDRIVEKIRLLQKHGIQPDLLCTVNQQTCRNAYAVYQNLKNLNTGWIQFIPVVNKDEKGNLKEESLDPDLYGSFLKTIFHQWFYNDFGKLGVQLFMEMLQVYLGGKATLCYLQEECGNVLAVESDGSIYSCDHYVNKDAYLGFADHLEAAAGSRKQKEFGQRKKDLPEKCQGCSYLSLCNGGCPKDRDTDGFNILCEAMQIAFREAEEPLKKTAQLLKEKKTAEQIRKQLREERKTAWKDVSGNALCPCGSLRKYKHCCRQ